MKVADAIAHILKIEGIEFLFAYPVNPIIEAAAKVGIRPIIVRQERTGLHMADALSRVSSGQRLGVFVMQYGPGAENAFGGVAQAYGESAPILVMPGGYPRALGQVPPNFNAFLNYQHVTKSCEQVTLATAVPDVLRRAFAGLRSGRPRVEPVRGMGARPGPRLPRPSPGRPVPAPAPFRPPRRRPRGGAGGRASTSWRARR